MEPLEQVTVLITLMRRLSQLMDHERTVLRGLRLESLVDIQEEKAALAEAYEIELRRLRRGPETIAVLDQPVRERLHESMRSFQESLAANLDTLIDMQMAVEEMLLNIMHSLTRSHRGFSAAADEEPVADEPRGQIIPVAFNRKR
jgi:hypothetical protein